MNRFVVFPGFFSVLLMAGCSSLPDLDAGKRALTENSSAEAEQHFMALSRRGFPEATLLLGDIQRDQGNREKALELYRQSLELGVDKAYSRMARLHYRKSAGGQSPEQALSIIKEMEEFDELQAKLERANLYHEWPELTPFDTRLKLFDELIASGIEKACLYKGTALLNKVLDEERLQPDREKMTEAWNCLLGVVGSEHQALKPAIQLVMVFPEIGSIEALKDQLEDSDLGISRLYAQLGKAFYSDENKTTESLLAAKEYFLKATETDHEAWAELFRMALKYPHVTDSEELSEWFEKAKESGFKEADVWKAKQFLAGVYSITDPFSAEKLLLPHVEENAEASFLLGRLYLTEMLGQARFYEGFELLSQAAEMGKPEGYLEIARILHEGLGIAANPIQARIYAEKAWQMGARRAPELLYEIEASRVSESGQDSKQDSVIQSEG
ncbi:tetratricopeptide repeat protein [Endozoicomonas arenosclerae]|uniref:tetratricopeptide repeat protein n=1 Tax=Endozoicomonas arenosclerae TaxID=1633495 RepID=UPI000785DDA2|nr:tetratricopeptide repeat protein [Endozoicomonas arenosclerae]